MAESTSKRPHPARPSCSAANARPRRSPLVHTAASLSLSHSLALPVESAATGKQAWIFMLKQAIIIIRKGSSVSHVIRVLSLPFSSGLLLALASDHIDCQNMDLFSIRLITPSKLDPVFSMGVFFFPGGSESLQGQKTPVIHPSIPYSVPSTF